MSTILVNGGAGCIGRAVAKLRHCAKTLLFRWLGTRTGRARATPMPTASPCRILFLQYEASLGTAMVATPVFAALKAARPDSCVGVFCSTLAGSVLRDNPYIDRIVVTASAHRNFLAAAWQTWRASRRLARFDLCLTDSGNMRGRIAVLAWLTGARRRIGFTLVPQLYDTPLRLDDGMSFLDNNLNLARMLGFTGPAPERQLYFQPMAAAQAETLWPDGTAPRILFVTQTSGGQPTAWYDERFAAVADHFAERHGATPVFVGQAHQAEGIERIGRRMTARGLNLAGKTELAVLSALFCQADLVITLDTGAMHLARAAAVPTVIIAAAWQPAIEWLPAASADCVILRRGAIPCAECRKFFCATRECMDEISVDAVIEAAERLLAGHPAHPLSRDRRIARRLWPGRANAYDTPQPSVPPAARKYRIAYLVSHPIQYQAPLLRYLAAQPDIDLTVFFRSDYSIGKFFDEGFGKTIDWDVPLLDGYRHVFLPAFGRTDQIGLFRPFNHGMLRHLRAGKFDAVWVHGYAPWFNWTTILAARLLGIRTLVRDEATHGSKTRSPIKAALKRHLFFGPLKTIADGFLAIGTANRDYYVTNGVPPHRIFMTPYCVDNDYFRNRGRAAAALRDTLRRDLGLAPGRAIILYASKLQRRKRAADLLEAYGRLIQNHTPGTRPYLLFVGDGDTRPSLEAAAERFGDDVRFLGFRNQSELPALFDLCDVFVLPSVGEPWGLIVNEVMCVGRPVIVSDAVGCAPDLVRDGVNGFVYPAGNCERLAECLSTILQDGHLRTAMGKASWEIVSQWGFPQVGDGLRAALAAPTG